MIASSFQSTLLEFKKSKRKSTLLLILVVILINLCYLFIGTKKSDIAGIPQPWEAILFYIPLINSLFLSVLMAVLASRSMDLEHKGGTWNLLQTMQSKSSIFLGKILYGLFWLIAFGVLEMAATIVLAKCMGFPELPPIRGVMLTISSEIIGGMVIYQLQLILSLCFSGQFAALSINLCGTLAGFFLMYVDDRILTPWSLMGALRVLNMDYQQGDAYSTYTWNTVPFFYWLIAVLYLVGTLFIGLWLYSRIDEGSLSVFSQRSRQTASVHSGLPVELIKLKRSPVWIAFIIMPVISALIGVFNFSINQGVLKFSWAELWTQQSLFLGIFFLSPLIAIFCSLLWRMEHNGTNWNVILTMESPAKIVRDKLLTASGISALCILWIGLLYLASGKIIGLGSALPKEFYESMLCGILACIAIAAVQIYLSLIIRSFAIPVGIALGGGLAGIMFLTQGWGFFLPYAMLQMGLRSTNLTNDINIPAFIAVSCVYVLIFFVLSVYHIKHKDSKTQE